MKILIWILFLILNVLNIYYFTKKLKRKDYNNFEKYGYDGGKTIACRIYWSIGLLLPLMGVKDILSVWFAMFVLFFIVCIGMINDAN